MGVNTGSAAIHITPVAVRTFFKHAKRRARKLKNGDTKEEATDDILYDEAFHIVKAFIDLGTYNTVESLQRFTNTHVPAPYWACVAPVQVPFSSCNRAADALIDWFGPDDLKTVVGGERWWQIRGMDGIESEWITEKDYLQDLDLPAGKKPSDSETNVVRMEHLETVMLYVHGGAYFWGSINTHRYQLIRYARKMKGRVFAVNYRKAPQYPWPCPLQDVLASYFYLTSPPPGAPHKAIHPSKLVFAGDSAGAGLCISALTVLRDLGYPQPAGAVLISPWVDLTHSFPSIMENTATDIIPPHGFIHKPSPLWPIGLVGERARALPARTNPPPRPGHADTLKPSSSRIADQAVQRTGEGEDRGNPAHASDMKDPVVGDQQEMLEESPLEGQDAGSKHADPPSRDHDTPDPDREAALEFWEPKPPKVLMDNHDTKPLELYSQIQLYATNEQLTHPLVSPVVQGSLGNLCPLYILAGDGELLRDEIVYLAHKAASPKDFPTRNGVLKEGRRQKENAEKFQTPTKVHLQVYDDMCHVLTVFTFIDSAKYAYRSITEFVKHVTTHSEEHVDRNPFPEFHMPPADFNREDIEDARRRRESSRTYSRFFMSSGRPSPVDSSRSDIKMWQDSEKVAREEEQQGNVERMSNAVVESEQATKSSNLSDSRTKSTHLKPFDAFATANSSTASASPAAMAKSSSHQDIPGVSMIRERVDIFGRVRPMEPRGDVQALQIPPGQIGLIKEAPVRRWLAGQEIWDVKFKRSAMKVALKRKHYEEKAARLLNHAREQGLILSHDHHPHPYHSNSTASINGTHDIGHERRWGPFDIDGEQPPPSAIAGRRDTREAVALMKKMIYHTAPVTHKTVPKVKTSDAVRAAFDPEDHPTKAPKQSVSEQQTYARIVPFHGLRMWQGLVSYFMSRSTTKAVKSKDQAVEAVRSGSEKLTSSNNP
ncbi:alpha/beta-hydrolase [Cristinia sonorae]|uniref:Alpha/beta-hydrolase n=1 Tax=Cristinia sonorae TaxID=1940300 RepID=A0A8K0UWD7_9AGAR|nr:alpha/beta-hydrolase [Cristinia sonorae]